jgi:hypothetical protein
MKGLSPFRLFRFRLAPLAMALVAMFALAVSSARAQNTYEVEVVGLGAFNPREAAYEGLLRGCANVVRPNIAQAQMARIWQAREEITGSWARYLLTHEPSMRQARDDQQRVVIAQQIMSRTPMTFYCNGARGANDVGLIGWDFERLHRVYLYPLLR